MVDVNIMIKIPAVEKLLEYVASGIGASTGPMLAPWKARGTAKAAQIEAQGEAEAKRIKARGHADSLDIIGKAIADARVSWSKGGVLRGNVEMHDPSEIETRINFQEQKRTCNTRRVVEMAAETLKDEEVDNREVDHDWTARFFAGVQDVTSENMQQIWAKILAGEVEEPGRTSLHTLAILKNMTQRDAELFSRASRFVFADFILNKREHTKNIAGFPSLSEFLDLESYGLIKTSGSLSRRISVSDGGSYKAQIGNALYKISATGEETAVIIPSYRLTPQGMELYGFVGATLDSAYARELAIFIGGKGFQLEQAQITEIIEEIDGGYRAAPWEVIV